MDAEYFLYHRLREWRVSDKIVSAGRMTPILRIKFESRKAECLELVLKSAIHLVGFRLRLCACVHACMY